MNKILLIGAGHMGKSLLTGWLKSNITNITIVDPLLSQKKKSIFGIKIYKSYDEIKNVNNHNIIFFAIKPQILKKVLNDYKTLTFKKKLIISIVAGKKINFFEKVFGKNLAIIRTMPNLPSSVGKGVTCIFANKNVNNKQKKFTNKLFSSVGKTFWVKKENFINKFTSLSGSGPAYYYHFIECLKDAGIKLGLSKVVAYEVAKETAIGSIKLLELSNENAKVLRENICVKGGTTEAAIKKLKRKNLMKKTIFLGVNAAFKRANKLGQEKK